MHVVGHVVRVRHDRVEFQIVAGDFGFQPGVDDRRFVEAVGRQKRQKVPHVLVCGGLGLHHLMDVAVARLVVGAPSSSRLTSSPVTSLMTSGPVTNM